MPIRPFLNGEAFDPETLDAMGMALVDACLALKLKVGHDAATRLLAMRIIDLARDGIHDREILKAAALRGFRPPA